jgi:hypothetical protein
VFVQGNEVDSSGAALIEQAFTPLVSGSNYGAVVAFNDFSSGFVDGGEGSFSAVFDSSGRLTEVDIFGNIYRLEAGGTHAEFGTDGILAWGRWTGDVLLPFACEGPCTVNYNNDQGLHYVAGVPTPVMPTNGSATYSLLGATSPTYVDGRTAPGTLTGALSVNFGQQVVGVDLNVRMPDTVYRIGGSASIINAEITGRLNNGLTLTGCSSSCDAFVKGFFAGASAERVGLGYHIADFDLGKQVVGAAAFKKD